MTACKVLKVHDDGDKTVKCGDTVYVKTTDGRSFKEEKIDKKQLKRYSTKDIKVYMVNGDYIRDNIFEDFTEGGHDKVYKFIPYNEVWIDYENESDLLPIIAHELHERHLMEQGLTYNYAHNKANIIELYVRRHPEEADVVIRRELRHPLTTNKYSSEKRLLTKQYHQRINKPRKVRRMSRPTLSKMK